MSDINQLNTRLLMVLGLSKESSEIVMARIGELESENARLKTALTPREWRRPHNEAWHRNIPDVHDAFKALRDVAANPRL